MTSRIRVRTLRVASGAHFFSFETGSSGGRDLAEELERLPTGTDLVLNLDGLDLGGVREVIDTLAHSRGAPNAEGQLVIVSEDADARRAFEDSRLQWPPVIEKSLDEAFRYVLARELVQELSA